MRGAGARPAPRASAQRAPPGRLPGRQRESDGASRHHWGVHTGPVSCGCASRCSLRTLSRPHPQRPCSPSSAPRLARPVCASRRSRSRRRTARSRPAPPAAAPRTRSRASWTSRARRRSAAPAPAPAATRCACSCSASQALERLVPRARPALLLHRRARKARSARHAPSARTACLARGPAPCPDTVQTWAGGNVEEKSVALAANLSVR